MIHHRPWHIWYVCCFCYSIHVHVCTLLYWQSMSPEIQTWSTLDAEEPDRHTNNIHSFELEPSKSPRHTQSKLQQKRR